MKYERPGRKRANGGVPVAMLDIFLLSLMYMAVFSSSGPVGIKTQRLPELRVGTTGPDTAVGRGVAPLRIELAGDGRATVDGQDVPLAALADRVAEAKPPDRPILFAIDVDKTGAGALGPFLQVQSDLSQRSLWARTTVLYRSASPTTPERGRKP